jgi:hypothetical protein
VLGQLVWPRVGLTRISEPQSNNCVRLSTSAGKVVALRRNRLPRHMRFTLKTLDTCFPRFSPHPIPSHPIASAPRRTPTIAPVSQAFNSQRINKVFHASPLPSNLFFFPQAVPTISQTQMKLSKSAIAVATDSSFLCFLCACSFPLASQYYSGYLTHQLYLIHLRKSMYSNKL